MSIAKPIFYLAGKYSQREELSRYASQLRGMGFYVQAEWLEGTHEDRSPEAQRRYAFTDLQDIYNSDAFVYFNTEEHSAGRNIEFGYAYANQKTIYLIGPQTSVFHYLATVNVFPTFREFVEYLKGRY